MHPAVGPCGSHAQTPRSPGIVKPRSRGGSSRAATHMCYVTFVSAHLPYTFQPHSWPGGVQDGRNAPSSPDGQNPRSPTQDSQVESHASEQTLGGGLNQGVAKSRNPSEASANMFPRRLQRRLRFKLTAGIHARDDARTRGHSTQIVAAARDFKPVAAQCTQVWVSTDWPSALLRSRPLRTPPYFVKRFI